MSGSLTRGGGENVPGTPGACAPSILRIWQEVHDQKVSSATSPPSWCTPTERIMESSLLNKLFVIKDYPSIDMLLLLKSTSTSTAT